MELKRNSFVRGLFFWLIRYRQYFIRKTSFAKCSSLVTITPPCYVLGYKNISIGEKVSIGPGAFISTPNAKLKIGNYCAIAEGLTIHTGNHVRVTGKYLTDINESNKPMGYDKDVEIGDECWIGCHVTILSGVTIGRGVTLAAGAVVNKSLPPYSICGGVPAKPLKFYWSVDQIMEHEAQLYPINERHTRSELEKIFAKSY
jgi:acetyltransferase-like isoleucine patch superfamily enzyme